MGLNETIIWVQQVILHNNYAKNVDRGKAFGGSVEGMKNEVTSYFPLAGEISDITQFSKACEQHHQ